MGIRSRAAGSSTGRAFAILLLFASACAAPASGPAARPPTALERAYPVLRWVPADSSYAAVTGRVADGALAARELAELASIAQGVTAEELDAWLRSSLGASLIAADDLAGAGIDLDGSAALFAQAGFPTAALPVADADRLRGFLARRGGGAATRHRGHQVGSWSRDGWQLTWVALDRWLLVHLGPSPRAGVDLAWLDGVLAAPDGVNLGADQDLAAALARGRRALAGTGGEERAPGLIGLVRTAALARDLAGWPDAPDGLASCAKRAADAAPRLLWAADFSPRGGAGWAALDLAPDVARALRAHVAEAPPPGYRAYRDGAALAMDWSVELAGLERARAALACPGLEEPLRDPVREATGFAGPRGWHLAATSIDLDDLSGAGAAHLVLADPALIAAQLESIPGRSWFERSRRVAGTLVQILSVPGLPTITYRLAGERFTLAVGDGVMEDVLAPAERGGAGDGDGDGALELARIALRPPRLPELGRIIDTGLAALAGPRARPAGRAIAARLSRYDEAALSARLDGNSVAIFARMRTRRTGHFLPTRRGRTSLW